MHTPRRDPFPYINADTLRPGFTDDVRIMHVVGSRLGYGPGVIARSVARDIVSGAVSTMDLSDDELEAAERIAY